MLASYLQISLYKVVPFFRTPLSKIEHSSAEGRRERVLSRSGVRYWGTKRQELGAQLRRSRKRQAECPAKIEHSNAEGRRERSSAEPKAAGRVRGQGTSQNRTIFT